MAITKQAEGTWAVVSAATQTVTIPSGVAAGDLLLLLVTWKGTSLPNSSAVTSTQGGWSRVNTYNNGTTASGNGTGSNMVEVWAKEHSGTEGNPTIHFEFDDSMVATPAAAVIIAFRKDTGYNWVLPLSGSGGGTTSTVTSYSQASVSDPGVTAGDVCVAVLGSRDDTAWTVPTFTQTGITWDTATVCPATPVASTTSNDISATAVFRTASSGTSSAAPTVTGTLAAAETAAHMFVRIRQEAAATPKSGSDSGTGADSVSSLGAAISGTDAGTGGDAASGHDAAVSGSDAGVGGDTAAKGVAVQDQGTGADSSSLGVSLTGSDAGAGADTGFPGETVDAELSGSDAGTGADTGSLSASLSGSDAGVGSDPGASVAQTKTASDAGVGVEVGGGGGPTTVGQDDFSSAAGVLAGTTADTGGTWSALTGTPRVTGSAVGQGSNAAGSGYLGSVAVGDGDVYGTIGGGRGFHNYQSLSQTTGVMARVSSGGPHAYVVTGVEAVEDGLLTLYLWRITSGAATLIGTIDPGIGWPWRVRLHVEGSSPTIIRVRLWQDGTSEPGTWNAWDTSDNTAANQMASGSVGVYSGNGYSSGEYIWLDDFLVVTTGAGGLAGQVTAAISASDTGTGVESVSSRGIPSTEAGVGTDTGSIVASFTVTDAGSGVETASVSEGVTEKTGADAGTAVETASVGVSLSVQDQGSGSDAGSLAAAFALTDSSVAGESGSLGSLLTGSEAGTGQETGALVASVSSSDAGTGSETGTTGTPVSASDAATGTDTASLAVVVSGADAGSGSDAAAKGLSTTEAGAGSDTSSLSAVLTRSEAGSATDAAALAVLLSLSDGGTGVESASVDQGTVPKTASDAGVAVETATVTVAHVLTDTGLGIDAASLSVLFGVSDSTVASDVAALAALLSAVDGGTGRDGLWAPDLPGATTHDASRLGVEVSDRSRISGDPSDGPALGATLSAAGTLVASGSDGPRMTTTTTDGG